MGRGRVAVWVGGAAAIAVATFACGQLVGIGNDPPQGPISPSTEAGAEGGFTYGQGECATCVETSCNAEATACAGTPSCAALEGCLSDAGTDPTKRAQCGVDHGLGNDVATPGFEACLAMSCSTQCGLTCGGLAAVFPPATATACEACIVANACASVSVCAANRECQGALRCQFANDTLDVEEACPTVVPDAGPGEAYNRENAPIASACSTECSWGADWSCVGKITWPPATLGSVELEGHLFDPYTQAPVADATVKCCVLLDQKCMTPLVEGGTDDAGAFAVLRPPVTDPQVDYLDFASSSIVPTLAFDPFPISEPRLVFYTAPLSLDELEGLALSVGVTLDDTLGTVFVIAADCRGGTAPGVQVGLTPKATSTRLFYFEGDMLSMTATATDSSGLAVFFNVPVSTGLEVTTTPQALGRASGNVAMFVRGGGQAFVYASPTPPP